MDEELRTAAEWLLDASAAVPDDYVRLPVAGKEEPVYRERVYCYELYHQWRLNWSDDFPYTLCAEIDKAGHPIIRGCQKPDFLVHDPGDVTNLVAVEVKPGNAKLRKMVKDLKTLTYFRRDLGDGQNYFAAYFWVYGINEADWKRKSFELSQQVVGQTDVDLSLIRPVIHQAPGHAATFVTWQVS